MKLFAGVALLFGTVSLAGCGGGASDLQSSTESAGLIVVDQVPSNYIPTPHGLYHESCVHELPDGAEIDADGNVTNPDGTTSVVAPCEYPRAQLRIAADATDATTNGWVEYSSAFAAVPATKLTARFGIPQPPTTQSDQVVFFFPGMEPTDGTIILQPVLQWGTSAAGGGQNWAIASWSCGPSCVHSKLVSANTGDSLSGSVTGSKCSSTGQCTWKIVTTDNTTNHSTTLTTHGDQASYTWLQSGVLEAYSVSDCSQYPTTAEVFSHVDFYDQTGALMTPDWSSQDLGQQPSCNFSVTPAENGATITF